MKVFISGPMSGYEDFNRPAFMAAEKLLKEAGFDVFNPAWMDVGLGEQNVDFYSYWEKKELLAMDIHALSCCDAIYHLSNWHKSDGARLEHAFARQCYIPSLVRVMVSNTCDRIRWIEDYISIEVPMNATYGALLRYLEPTFTYGITGYDDGEEFKFDTENKIPDINTGAWIVVYMNTKGDDAN